MNRLACRVALAALICVIFAPLAVAEEALVAKVYRDYPGYIEPPTCINPRLSDSSDYTATTPPQSWNCPQTWTFTPMLGYHGIDGGLQLKDNASIGLAIGYNLTGNWAIEADLRYTPTETDLNQANNRDVDIWILGGGALYHFQPQQRLNPYLAAGAGMIIYDVDGANEHDEDLMGYWGGGLKYGLNQNTALRVDVRHILDYRTDDGFSKHDDSTWRHHLSAMVGLTFLFGS